MSFLSQLEEEKLGIMIEEMGMLENRARQDAEKYHEMKILMRHVLAESESRRLQEHQHREELEREINDQLRDQVIVKLKDELRAQAIIELKDELREAVIASQRAENEVAGIGEPDAVFIADSGASPTFSPSSQGWSTPVLSDRKSEEQTVAGITAGFIRVEASNTPETDIVTYTGQDRETPFPPTEGSSEDKENQGPHVTLLPGRSDGEGFENGQFREEGEEDVETSVEWNTGHTENENSGEILEGMANGYRNLSGMLVMPTDLASSGPRIPSELSVPPLYQTQALKRPWHEEVDDQGEGQAEGYGDGAEGYGDGAERAAKRQRAFLNSNDQRLDDSQGLLQWPARADYELGHPSVHAHGLRNPYFWTPFANWPIATIDDTPWPWNAAEL